MIKKAATLFDVAHMAGVSHQTVSRVINGHPNVRASTRQRVESAITDLNYVPSTAARALVTRRSKTIGVINSGATDFGPASVANSFSTAAGIAGYAVSIAAVRDASAASIRDGLNLLMRQNVEAIVLIAATTSAAEAVAGLRLTLPLLTVDSLGHADSRALSLDQYSGARVAVRHLIDLGHRDIIHVSGPVDSLDAIERVRGWHDELNDHRLRVTKPVIGNWTAKSGYLAGEQLAKTARKFTAVFAANDQMALGAIHSLLSHGVAVPGDVSIVGFDDIPEAEHFYPPLTTMHQDFDALGRQLLQRLVEVLDGEEPEAHHRDVPSLILRSSTAPMPESHIERIPSGGVPQD